ncbi:MAG TPA: class I SAM-dependent methyltransferase, partial [Oscillatoriaceae cyanobacterium]
MASPSRAVREFGDFQTPLPLAQQVVARLRAEGVSPGLVIEPSCGRGAFVRAALEGFPEARVLSVEINPEHLAIAQQALEPAHAGRCTLFESNFFAFDWPDRITDAAGPLLVLGNPPWVTNAELGRLASANQAPKANRGQRGIEALTGASNFELSEAMLATCLDWGGTVAVLCKTAIARKLLAGAWRAGRRFARARIFRVDAAAHFGASVEACLFWLEPGDGEAIAEVYDDLEAMGPSAAIAWRDGQLVADADAYDRWRHLRAEAGEAPWRSGVKHDAAAVFELEAAENDYRNGLGEVVEVERDHVYPLLKGAELARGVATPRRALLVPQRTVGENTRLLAETAPKTWAYLERNGDRLAARASRVYNGRAPFSVFGVGPYTFAPWKVAVAGFAKSLRFAVVGPVHGAPVVFDDTVA